MSFLYELGLVSGSGFGTQPLSFTEIKAWSELTDMRITPFEVSALRRLSQDACSVLNAKDNNCPVSVHNDEVNHAVSQANFAALAASLNGGES